MIIREQLLGQQSLYMEGVLLLQLQLASLAAFVANFSHMDKNL